METLFTSGYWQDCCFDSKMDLTVLSGYWFDGWQCKVRWLPGSHETLLGSEGKDCVRVTCEVFQVQSMRFFRVRTAVNIFWSMLTKSWVEVLDSITSQPFHFAPFVLCTLQEGCCFLMICGSCADSTITDHADVVRHCGIIHVYDLICIQVSQLLTDIDSHVNLWRKWESHVLFFL